MSNNNDKHGLKIRSTSRTQFDCELTNQGYEPRRSTCRPYLIMNFSSI